MRWRWYAIAPNSRWPPDALLGRAAAATLWQSQLEHRMAAFADLIASITAEGDAYNVAIPESWLQGRTAYGGLSAALCLETALRAVPELPPLRAAQFALIGPASGPLTMRASVLRRGKSAVNVGVDLSGEAGLATRAILTFGVARKSVVAYENLPMPKVTSIAGSPPFFPGERSPITFQQHFESRLGGGARPMTPDAAPEMDIWFRHRDARAHDGIVPLVALADAPPPAAMVMFPQAAPISTMTWTMDVLSDAPKTDDGWWLVQSRADNAHQGYAAHAMMIWNARGEPIIAARQTVAIFL
jgi:acyl-CoA thioesterase